GACGQGRGDERTPEPVIDGLAETMIGDRHDRYCLCASLIERPERGEEIRRGLDEITPTAEIDSPTGKARCVRAEGQKRFPAARPARVEAGRRCRRIVGGELTRRGQVANGLRCCKFVLKDPFDLLPRKSTKAKQSHFVSLDPKHCRLKPERARTSVKNHGG